MPIMVSAEASWNRGRHILGLCPGSSHHTPSAVRENTVLPAITPEFQGGYSDFQQDIKKKKKKLTRLFL